MQLSDRKLQLTKSTDLTICYVRDLCAGDSGGPVYATMGTRQTLVGIVSRGVAQCKKGYSKPSVNVDVFKLRSKIDTLIKKCWR